MAILSIRLGKYVRTAAPPRNKAWRFRPSMCRGRVRRATMAINPEQLLRQQRQQAVVGWVVAMSGQQKGQDFRLHDGRNILGTAADCDIVIYDPYVGAAMRW
jgi:hypothetical protein